MQSRDAMRSETETKDEDKVVLGIGVRVVICTRACTANIVVSVLVVSDKYCAIVTC